MSTKCQLKSVISHRIAGIIGITIPNIPYKNYMDTKYGCGYRDGIINKALRYTYLRHSQGFFIIRDTFLIPFSF